MYNQDFISGVRIVSGNALCSTAELRRVAAEVSGDYFLFMHHGLNHDFGYLALERMLSVAEDTSADMLYSDFRERIPSGGGHTVVNHPLIECQAGALRDDFDFGTAVLFRTASFRKAVAEMSEDYAYGAFYDLRLRMCNIVHLNEFLYTCDSRDLRASGVRQFDYVDAKNREVQIEMEAICTSHLKRIGAYLKPEFKDAVDCDRASRDCGSQGSGNAECPVGAGKVTASVVIPVYNRVRTVADAVGSALRQKCSFPFNVIVVDNHSTDGTSELLAGLASEDSRLLHIVPERTDLGIGGCWNTAVHHPECGEYAIQLDSDDLYSSDDVIEKIVAEFRRSKCAMVIGTYMMTDFDLNPIPPGIIDHKEWTPENGRNNALRINGLGAPRAFFVPLLRKLNLPDTSYGEDYAAGLRLSREYRIGRIYDVLYLCRRWEGNSDACLNVEKLNRNNFYKDKIRTIELAARMNINSTNRNK